MRFVKEQIEVRMSQHPQAVSLPDNLSFLINNFRIGSHLVCRQSLLQTSHYFFLNSSTGVKTLYLQNDPLPPLWSYLLVISM